MTDGMFVSTSFTAERFEAEAKRLGELLGERRNVISGAEQCFSSAGQAADELSRLGITNLRQD